LASEKKYFGHPNKKSKPLAMEKMSDYHPVLQPQHWSSKDRKGKILRFSSKGKYELRFFFFQY
jgi:hypothetical protein